jgi:hypothetical protein
MKIDLCIVMDTTGSMGSWLAEAKKCVGSLLVDIPQRTKAIKGEDIVLRVAFVAYKDLPDVPDVCDFTSDLSSIEQILRKVTAQGGGDLPEDVDGALAAVRSLKWAQSAHKIMVHVLDAPPHGSEFNDLGPAGDKRFHDSTPLRTTVCSLAADNIQYIMVRCGNPKDIASTSKYARLVESIYKKEANRMRADGIPPGGRLPPPPPPIAVVSSLHSRSNPPERPKTPNPDIRESLRTPQTSYPSPLHQEAMLPREGLLSSRMWSWWTRTARAQRS